MFTILSAVTLPHPPESVFAALASVEGTVRWQAGVRCVRRPRRDAERPAELVLHYWALGVRHALRTRITAHEPSRRFAYSALGDHFGYDAAFSVEPARDGALVTCQVTLHHPPDAGDAGADARFELARLRRLLTRRLPRDLARLEAWVAVQRQPTSALPA